jgi:hypothetical protein
VDKSNIAVPATFNLQELYLWIFPPTIHTSSTIFFLKKCSGGVAQPWWGTLNTQTPDRSEERPGA